MIDDSRLDSMLTNNLVSVYTEQGRRRTMEDTFVNTSEDIRGIQVNIYGVFDGHGGSITSGVTADNISKRIFEALSESTSNFDDIESMKKLFEDVILTFDQYLFQQGFRDGSTLTMVVDLEKILYCINLGDSRTIMVKNGKILFGSTDHKPDDERDRIYSAKGYVMMGRVNGALAVSRALGDFTYKMTNAVYQGRNAIVSPVPDVTAIILPKEEKNAEIQIILASDGLWDVFSNEEIAEEIQNERTCQEIVEEAFNRGSEDNITLMIIKKKI